MLSICLVKVKVAMYCTVTCVTQVYVTPHTEIDTHTVSISMSFSCLILRVE